MGGVCGTYGRQTVTYRVVMMMMMIMMMIIIIINVSNIPGKHEVKELQKTVILGTAHIFRKVLM